MGKNFPCIALMEWAQDSWWVWVLLFPVLAVLFWVFRFFILVRLPLWILTHTVYRLRVHGVENIPPKGPALLVSNHVSYIDALVILAALKRRVRFLFWAPFLKHPFLRWALRLSGGIPIDAGSGPRAIIQSLRAAGEALAQGDLVCIFAEGGITRTGFLLPFNRGFEQIVKRSPAPIIPVCLDHVWGSIFSYEGGRFFWKWPKEIPYRVHVGFGPPLPPTATAFEVRQAIQKNSADSAIRRASERRPVHRQFVRMAVRHPFRPCLVDENAAKPVMKYGEALAGAKILANHLRPVLGDDPMVGLWLPSSTGGALANIALAFLGKTAVNLNYSATQEIVQSSIRQCGIKKVLTSKLFTHRLPLDPGPNVELVYLEDFRKKIGKWERIRSFLSVLLFPGFIQERWILGLRNHSMDQVLTVIFSSGSTGEPKGVMLTHGNIAANAESMVQTIDPGPEDRILGILPFFHSFGYTVTLWVPLQVGASTLYYPNPLQAREIGELCGKYRPSIMLITPTFLRNFLRRCKKEDFSSLRLLMCGAEKLPRALAEEFKDKFGVLPLEGYGCTELSPAAVVNVPDWGQGSQRQVGNKPGTIGRPLPGVAAAILHKETLQPLPPGQEGLLFIYGANVLKGYLGRDDLTRNKIRDGWYNTGDLAVIDEEGFITITGREERFAKIGGEMVPLEKVEEELHAVLGTNERLCAVTAIPDERKGERIIVLHLPLDGQDPAQICQKMTARGLPNIYLPGPRDFFQVDIMPVLGSGKLDLKKCKEKALELVEKGKTAP